MSLEIVTSAPDPRLRRFVTAYHGYRERTGGRLAREELPHAGVTVIVNLGPALEVDGARFASFAGGLYERPIPTAHAGEQAGLQLTLPAPAARMLLGLPLAELTERTVALDDLLGRAARELPERLLDLPAWRDRFALVDAFVARRLRDAAPPPAPVIHAWCRIVASGGRARVEDVAREIGWSRRHLAARVRTELGLPPKALARLVRFERVTAALRAPDPPPLAALAALAGYADQAHLTREFRGFAGRPPSAYEFPDVQDPGAAAA